MHAGAARGNELFVLFTRERSMSGHRATLKQVLKRFLVLITVTLAVWGASAAADSQGEESFEAIGLWIKVDRTVGLVPMTVEISGALRNSEHQPVNLGPDQKVVLEIESSYYRVAASDRSQNIVSAGTAALDSAGVTNPLVRNLMIKRAGTYRFQLVFTDSDGGQIRSNKVQVKAK
jgi:hypothetical protein